jgi:hypothetical protein
VTWVIRPGVSSKRLTSGKRPKINLARKLGLGRGPGAGEELLPVPGGRDAGGFAEMGPEVGGCAEPDLGGNTVDGQVGAFEQFFGTVDALLMQPGERSGPGGLGEPAVEAAPWL